jgi:hypothetical protein
MKLTGWCLQWLAAYCVAGVFPQLHATTAERNPAGLHSRQHPDTVVRIAGMARHPGAARLVPELTIGTVDGRGEYWFAVIQSVLVARDGSVWVAEGGMPFEGPPQVRQYDSAGRFVRHVFRRGRGPGEYEVPRGLAQLADGRVVLRDLALTNRINVYGPDGRYDTTWTFRTPYQSGLSIAVDTAGIVWLPVEQTALARSPRAPSPVVTSAGGGFVRLRANGTIVDTIASPQLVEAPRPRTATVPPFYPRASFAWSPHGYLATYHMSRYAIDLRIPRRNASRGGLSAWGVGDGVVSVRRQVQPVVLSDAERRERRARFEAGERNERARRPGDWGQIPDIATAKPPIRTVRFGDDGRLWVQVSTPSERFEPAQGVQGPSSIPALRWREPTVFDVFEPDGRYIGQVVIPDDVYPMVMRGDIVWARVRVESDVSLLRRYRIAWQGA